MKKCKWTGDMSDEYCKSCNGITMVVDGNSISCEKCAGYEAEEDEADTNEEIMNPPVEEIENISAEDTTNNIEKSVEKTNKTEKSNNNTDTNKNVKSTSKNKQTKNQ